MADPIRTAGERLLQRTDGDRWVQSVYGTDQPILPGEPESHGRHGRAIDEFAESADRRRLDRTVAAGGNGRRASQSARDQSRPERRCEHQRANGELRSTASSHEETPFIGRHEETSFIGRTFVMSEAQQSSAPSIGEIVSREIERAIQRNIKGLEYFRLGDPPVAQTPRDVVYKRGTLELYHYRPLAEEIYRVPLLLVMSLVSKAYIFDLGPGQSLIEFLLKRGYDVYMIDWGVPRREDSRLKLEDYCLDFIPDCAGRMAEHSGEKDFSLLGYCMGGTLALIYAALFP